MIENRSMCIVAMTLTSALMSACTTPFPNFEASHVLRESLPKVSTEISWQAAQEHQMPVAVRTAVNRLISLIPESYRENIIMVGSVVDVNQVGSSSALGRVLSEQLQSVMSANGFGVVDISSRKSVSGQDISHELIFSKDGKEPNMGPNAPLVVRGTYAAGETVTFVHLKAIRAADGVIEAASEFTIPNDANVRKLLARNF